MSVDQLIVQIIQLQLNVLGPLLQHQMIVYGLMEYAMQRPSLPQELAQHLRVFRQHVNHIELVALILEEQ